METRAFGVAQREWILQRLAEVFDRDQLSQGPLVDELEAAFAAFVGRRHAVALSSGTVALELAARALRRRRSSARAAIPGLTVPMVGWAMERAGLEAVRLDVRPDFLVDPDALLHEARRSGFATLVWTAGLLSRDLIEVAATLRREEVLVLEDASHAHGCSLDGVAAGTVGDLAVFSFYATKPMTSGEGGLVALDDEDLTDWLRTQANGGKRRGSLVVESEGWSCRMTELQAAVALSCIRFWPELLARRDEVAACYARAGISPVQAETPGLRASWYKYTVRVADAAAATGVIRAAGGRTTQPTHSWDENGGKPFGLPECDRLAGTHVSLPTSRVSEGEIDRIVAAWPAIGT